MKRKKSKKLGKKPKKQDLGKKPKKQLLREQRLAEEEKG